MWVIKNGEDGAMVQQEMRIKGDGEEETKNDKKIKRFAHRDVVKRVSIYTNF